jgi:hypothetical protein
VDPRAGLDVEKREFMTLLRLELHPLSRPAHSQLLCQLCYFGTTVTNQNSIQEKIKEEIEISQCLLPFNPEPSVFLNIV